MCQEQPPTDAAAHHQKTWDSQRVSSIVDALSSDQMHRARFLAASCKESGAGTWLNALPISSLGLRMDDATVRISMGLHLGLPLCRSHTCQHCGAEVSQFATHGLSCRKSAGRYHCHSAVNDIIHRALAVAHVPSRLEPLGLYRSDGKRPDGVSSVPWKCSQFLVWDETILLHHLTLQLLHSKLEQLLNRLKIGRCRNINTLTHATFSLQWQ